MKFLHDKLENTSVPLNIRLFLAKLIINTEEVCNFIFLNLTVQDSFEHLLWKHHNDGVLKK